jgi:hypothetical protein
LVQLHAPKEIRGRVVGVYSMASLGLMSFSGLTIGVGGSFVGVHLSLGASAVTLFVVVLALSVFVLRSRLTEHPSGA